MRQNELRGPFPTQNVEAQGSLTRGMDFKHFKGNLLFDVFENLDL